MVGFPASHIFVFVGVPSLKLTQHLKHWGWKMSFLLGFGLLTGAMLVFGGVIAFCCISFLVGGFNPSEKN